MGRKWDKIWSELKFSKREARAVLFLLPMIAVLAWIIYAANRSTFSDEELAGVNVSEQRKTVADSLRSGKLPSETTLICFDPNTVTYEELRSMGMAKNTAAGIVKYREKGKIFEIPEDFATCYGVSDSMYAALKPYIRIAERYRPKPRAKNVETDDSVAPTGDTSFDIFDPNTLGEEGFVELGFSERQAEVIVRFRSSRGGFRTAEDFSQCYVVSPRMYEKLLPYISIAARPEVDSSDLLVDINSADSATLVGVRGIGPRTASEIIAYRDRLGGFYDIGQLSDLKVVTEKNYELMRSGIWADSFKIRKIDINFAAPNDLAGHPYLAPKRIRRILKNRQLRGGWSTIEDMIGDNTLSAEEAARLSPYLYFNAGR